MSKDISSKKAIIFDLDGTAIPNAPNALPSVALVEAVEKADKKMYLCAATGRPMTNAHYILKALNLTDPCVISAGTQIANPQTKEILWEILMNIEDSKKVIEICRPYPYLVLLRDGLMDTGKSAADIEITSAVNVMYIMQATKEDAEVLLSALSELKGIIASPVTSWKSECVDIHISDAKATKEHAIEELLRLLNLDKEEVVGVGDGDNDLHLFKSVGLKVAMGNATENLKKKADVVIESVEEDGLAKLITQYL